MSTSFTLSLSWITIWCSLWEHGTVCWLVVSLVPSISKLRCARSKKATICFITALYISLLASVCQKKKKNRMSVYFRIRLLQQHVKHVYLEYNALPNLILLKQFIWYACCCPCKFNIHILLTIRLISSHVSHMPRITIFYTPMFKSQSLFLVDQWLFLI